MRILITGGTGFIGRPLTQHLMAREHEVVVWSRDPEAARALLPDGAEVMATPEEATGVDAAINLAGENLGSGRWTVKRKQRFLESRLNVTQRLTEALRTAGVQRLVSASAIGFYGARGDGYAVWLARYPDHDVTIVILSNQNGAPVNDMRKALEAALFGNGA